MSNPGGVYQQQSIVEMGARQDILLYFYVQLGSRYQVLCILKGLSINLTRFLHMLYFDIQRELFWLQGARNPLKFCFDQKNTIF